ncbi:hypothetical protein LLS47_24275 [Rouxiella badensis]|uniref:AfsA-related hotdog domain-containing protein n=1 Tax=Rouxiella badensis TaxID=1646377 RepID=UPI001D14AF10|nr:AfsA-related hotdog domain-containing protein [Rouxiella badensis]MCC3736014.1 hypothetical protein [Rouxiella badensis]MCC3761411.1 hypothetical protein [Rouxiella badensis]
METLIVVGEKFKDFAEKNNNVMTVNAFERLVWAGEIKKINKVIIGQGVQLDDISRAICTIRKHYPEKINEIVNLNDLYFQNDTEHLKTVHKVKKENIVITSPEKIDEETYNSKLILQDSSELLCDHQTGQHLQGMVLIEASRQSVIATSEKYLLKEAGITFPKKYFTMTLMNISFSSFVFPLPVTVSLKVLSKKGKAGSKFKCQCCISFEQTGVKKAEILFSFTVYDLNYITQKECEQASLCHKSYLESI